MSDENRKPIRTLYREYPNIKEAIKKQGWRVEVTKGSHIKFIAPDGSCMFASGTPSDHRARKGMLADLRRRGLEI